MWRNDHLVSPRRKQEVGRAHLTVVLLFDWEVLKDDMRIADGKTRKFVGLDREFDEIRGGCGTFLVQRV